MPVNDSTPTTSPLIDEIKRRAIQLIITAITSVVVAWWTIRDNQSELNHRMSMIENIQKIQAEQVSKIATQADISAGQINAVDKNQAIITEQVAAMRREMDARLPSYFRR
jgi:hypothetical protein